MVEDDEVCATGDDAACQAGDRCEERTLEERVERLEAQVRLYDASASEAWNRIVALEMAIRALLEMAIRAIRALR
jgi:chaperonin cofactor prefoldin